MRQSNLTGFKVKEMTYCIVVTMFTDNTTVYLTENDDFGTLNGILQCWCNASGAKFNTSITEVIPIGTREYRERVLTTRKINESQPTLPDSIVIAKDEKATRILGAWIGNGIDEQAVWSPMLDKIEDSLQCWEKWHPTIEGRKIIIQRTIGSMTQYLTTAQGMPKKIEELLTKRSRTFAWDSGGINSVSMDILHAPLKEGRKGILNLKDRNEAIELKWLKGLLAPRQSKPTWAFFADALIAGAAQSSPVTKPETRISPFLQTWAPSPKKLHAHLRRIISTAKKYNARWETISTSPNIARKLPAWFHLGASTNLNKLNNHLYANCLRQTHGIISVGQLESMTERHDSAHRKHKNCACRHCTEDKTLQCLKPFKCKQLTEEALTCILPKWNPQRCMTPYTLSISPKQLQDNENDRNDQPPSYFDPVFPSPDSLEEGFRIFITPRTQCTYPASQTKPPQGPTTDLIKISVTGAHHLNQHGDHESGRCIWFGHNDNRNRTVKLPNELAAPGAGEAGTLLTAISTLPHNAPLQISLKSARLWKDLTVNLPKLEDTNWTTHPQSKILQAVIAKLRARCALTSFTEWNHHTPKLHSDEINELTNASLRKETHNIVLTEIDKSLDLTGIKLMEGTQRLFYLNIRQSHRPTKQQRRTLMNMAMTQHAIHEIAGKMPSPEHVWMSIRDRDTPKSIRGFLWKSLHGTYKIGDFWDKIPNYEQRGQSGLCHSPETMEHILLECGSLASRSIWWAASDLWCK